MDIEPQKSSFLELPSDLICEDPEVLKQWLVSALSAARPAIISGRLVTRVGTAALQLLVAFRRECTARVMQVEIRDASPSLLDTVACAGLSEELGLSRAAR